MIESIIFYFENIPSSIRTVILISGFTLLLLLENVEPLFELKYKKLKHAILNLFFTFTTLIINLSIASLILGSSIYVSSNKLGIIYLFNLPIWANVCICLIVLDLIGAYFVHWLEHQVKWMWKFHLIHHTDTKVDVTTALRHHPGESILRAIFTILAIFISGAPFGIVMLYQTISALFAQLTHANINLPNYVERIMSYFIVTPNFHKIHHHNIQPLTDKNYGNIFSIWDHLFNTSTYIKNMDLITYGIDTHMKEHEHNNLLNLLAIPFQEYRPPIGSKFNNKK
tara:strand:+ start:6802 stop:7650 length:849 start_codon:yes stop_codon:yes gene_type:complete